MYRCGISNRQCYQWVLVNGQFPLRLSIVTAPEVNDEAAYAKRGRSGCQTICFCNLNKISMTDTWEISISENVCFDLFRTPSSSSFRTQPSGSSGSRSCIGCPTGLHCFCLLASVFSAPEIVEAFGYAVVTFMPPAIPFSFDLVRKKEFTLVSSVVSVFSSPGRYQLVTE